MLAQIELGVSHRLRLRRVGTIGFASARTGWLVIAAAIERLANRIYPKSAHATARFFLSAGYSLVAIDVALVPHLSGAVIEHTLPTVVAARRNNDDRARIGFSLGTLWRLYRRFVP